MADPFHDIIESDLARKCAADAADVLRRAYQLCDTQRGCVVVGVAGVAGAVASLAGAFFAAYPDELTAEMIDFFWQDLARDIVIKALRETTPELEEMRRSVAGKSFHG